MNNLLREYIRAIKSINPLKVFYSLRIAYVKFLIKNSTKKRVMIYRDLASHLKTSSLSNTLISLQRESENLKLPEQLFYEVIQNGIENDSNFYEQITEWMPEMESLMIVVSRQSRRGIENSLVNSINQARVICENLGEIKSIYMGKLIYPIGMLIIAICLFGLFKYNGFEMLTDIRPYEEWPADVRSRYESIGFITDNLIIIIIGILLLGVAITKLMTAGRGYVRDILDPIPPFSIYRALSGYTFLLALSTMEKSGVPIKEAIGYMRESFPGWASNHVNTMIQRFENPGFLSRTKTITEHALDSKIFTKLIRVKVGSYARRDDFVENLEYVNEVLFSDVKKEAFQGAAWISVFIMITLMFFVINVVLVFYGAMIGDGNLTAQ